MAREQLSDFEARFATIEATGAVVPNSMLTMGRAPDVLSAYLDLSGAVYKAGEVPADLKRLVAHVASRASGCQYCAAHNGARARLLGVADDKLAAVWAAETSTLFTEAERAALRLAVQSAQRPNEVDQATFVDLRRHFSETGIVELVAVVALAAFTNRWNDTFATDMEPEISSALA